MNEKKNVKTFKKKYKIKTVDSSSIRDALGKQGFTVVEYNGIDDSEDVNALISALEIRTHILANRCFAYQDDKYRLVFLYEALNEDEKTIVLAHEEGHIWNSHFSSNSILGNDVRQEYQANEFSHYLLDDKTGKKKKIKIGAFFCVLILAIVLVAGCYFKNQHDERVYTDNLYRTATGNKYHVRNCMYIKDKTDVQQLTREEFDSGEYEPCGACRGIE